jgi:hypothetical protein
MSARRLPESPFGRARTHRQACTVAMAACNVPRKVGAGRRPDFKHFESSPDGITLPAKDSIGESAPSGQGAKLTRQGFALISLRDMGGRSQKTRKSERTLFHAVSPGLRGHHTTENENKILVTTGIMA